MKYPFDQRFIFAVENLDWQENPWLLLITSDGCQPERLIDTLKENGYPPECVQKNITLLTALDLDHLVNLAMLPDYRSEPALAVLKTRATEDVFVKAQALSQSSSNQKRALAIKILNSPYQDAFFERTKSLLKQLQATELDDLVIEQLGYAFSKLQIN
jgi:hypothetical protein